MPNYETLSKEIENELFQTMTNKPRKNIYSEKITIPIGKRILQYKKITGERLTFHSITYN